MILMALNHFVPTVRWYHVRHRERISLVLQTVLRSETLPTQSSLPPLLYKCQTCIYIQRLSLSFLFLLLYVSQVFT